MRFLVQVSEILVNIDFFFPLQIISVFSDPLPKKLTMVPLERFDYSPERRRIPAPIVVQRPVQQTAPQIRDHVAHESPSRRSPQRLYRRSYRKKSLHEFRP